MNCQNRVLIFHAFQKKAPKTVFRRLFYIFSMDAAARHVVQGGAVGGVAHRLLSRCLAPL